MGEAIEYISYFILAFEEIGKKGIGKTKAPFRIEKVQCAGKHIYDPEMKKITRDFPMVNGRDFMKEKTQVQSITMEMESPLRLKFGRKFQKYISFDMLVPNLLRRIQLLSALYCGGPARVDFKELIEKAKEVKVSDSEIHWEEQRRFSFRQERTLSLGGVSGSIEFTGDISPYIPFLRIGEYLHVGKGTAFETFSSGTFSLQKIYFFLLRFDGGSFPNKAPGLKIARQVTINIRIINIIIIP